jgi:tripartite ATP-independent transporter DctP family solute receptor
MRRNHKEVAMTSSTITRRQALAGIASLAGSALVPRLGHAADAPITLRLGLNNGPSHFMAKGAQKFGELVAAKSGGTVTIRVFPGGQLGGERDMAEGVKVGTLDAAILSAGVLANFDPFVGIYELRFLFDDYPQAFRAQDGPVFEETSRRLQASSGMRLLGFFDNGFRYVFTRSKTLRSINDFKGVKIRVPEAPSYVKTFEQLGASPTVVPFPELYTALQTGLVEGYEGNPASNVEQKFFEVTKFIAPTKHLFLSAAVIMSERKFQSLTPAQRDAVLAAFKEALVYEREIGSRLEDGRALDVLTKEKGLTLTPIDTKPIKQAVRPVLEWYAERIGPEGMRWIERLNAT